MKNNFKRLDWKAHQGNGEIEVTNLEMQFRVNDGVPGQMFSYAAGACEQKYALQTR